MPIDPETSRSKVAIHPSTPASARIATSAVQSSPHYVTTRRHSLYGTEDRIIIDPGSRIWKVGFSGEGRPRDVFYVEKEPSTSLWSLSRPHVQSERDEEDRVLKIKLQHRLRRVFHEILLTDPKSRKVIIVEHPLLPLHVKDMMASVMFDNLQIPSLSFVSSHLLSLLGVGRITGLVLDCGHLESTVLPIFSSRPLFPLIRSTPLAGLRLTSHLRALLLMFATYLPPLGTLGGAANIPAASRSMRVPEDILTDAVMEDIKARCCFVGEAFDADQNSSMVYVDDGATETDVPPSDSSLADHDQDMNRGSVDFPASPPSSRLSSVTSPSGFSSLTHALSSNFSGIDRSTGEHRLQAMATMYSRHSTATELHIRVDPPTMQVGSGTGKGTLVIPGWVRERAAEVLFEGGDVDESSVAEVLLDVLLKVPIDLRKSMASSILVVGGTPMLPGFIPRLHTELVRLLTRPVNSHRQSTRRDRPVPPTYDPYTPLRPLAPSIAILNNPSPPLDGNVAGGKAPAFTSAALPWVGGSLAGAMKIGGIEITREKWDEAEVADEAVDGDNEQQTGQLPLRTFHLPDWTRAPLPQGAPPAPRAPKPIVMQAETAVGA